MKNHTVKHKKIFPFSVFRFPSSGFTLMELLVVMAILGILVTVGLTSYKSVQAKSRDSKRKSDLKQIATALEFYFNDYGTYPSDTNFQIYGCGTAGTSVCEWGSPFQTLKTGGTNVKTMYMPKLPSDPATGRVYYYDKTGTSPPSYQLYARLENTQDNDIPHSGTTAQSYTGTNCSSGSTSLTCNYGVSSANKTPEDGRTPLQ
ncbi:MAG: prepilin-type N-terminal cleavage/methylation domain-containing protein [Candidatus Gottesmanbacteria bacterium]|nr:prepilin-type N-terminal cleavage/methylation domain-containing protein [Candidatus Gottesmanbacteria bacterium]